ncbi:C-C motif chemokine 5-like [Thamnophis elegans]|uniref:C-C motif chemokine 5-like n=1 Tax=Thamnophis elegans TaxID=35005 RepID=UPI001378CDF8|nr:C-C motif chemokine 5-like [Thamnophis elegans]
MKISVVAFMFLFLVVSISLPVTDALGFDSTICCLSYTKRKIPKHRVKSFFSTSGACQLPAIVFILRNDMPACVNPGEEWVTNIVRYFNEERRS